MRYLGFDPRVVAQSGSSRTLASKNLVMSRDYSSGVVSSANSAWDTNRAAGCADEGVPTRDASLTNSDKQLVGMTMHIAQTSHKYNPDVKIAGPDDSERRLLTQPSEGLSNGGQDNEDANLICRVHDELRSEDTGITYTVLDLLGTGTFGQVFKCQKQGAGVSGIVAVKVIKNKSAYHSQGLVEISIIKTLGKKNNDNLVRMEESFQHRGHICIVFELLSISLLDVLTANQYRGLPLPQVQSYAKQMIHAFITLEETNIIHCDLKPENILLAAAQGEGTRTCTPQAYQGANHAPESSGLENGSALNGSIGADSCLDEKVISNGIRQLGVVDNGASGTGEDLHSKRKTGGSNPNPNPNAIKIIDFGSACFEGKTVYSYIQSRFYRSPEVLLGVPYNGAIDMWSLACVCVEMYLGLPLFPGVSQHNQLSRICAMLGQPPDVFLEGKNGAKYFTRREVDGDANGSGENASKYRIKTPEEYARATGTEIPELKRYLRYDRLDEVVMKCPLVNKSEMTPEQKQSEMLLRASFLDFLMGMFKTNPFERWTAKQAALHPFITGALYSKPHSPAVDQKVNERKLAFLLAMQRRGYSGSNLMSICKTSAPTTATPDKSGAALGMQSGPEPPAINAAPAKLAAPATVAEPAAESAGWGPPRLQRMGAVVPISASATKNTHAAASVGVIGGGHNEQWRQSSRLVPVPKAAPDQTPGRGPVSGQGNANEHYNAYSAYSARSPQANWLNASQQAGGLSRLMSAPAPPRGPALPPGPPTAAGVGQLSTSSGSSSGRTPDSTASAGSSPMSSIISNAHLHSRRLTDFNQAMNRPDINQERRNKERETILPNLERGFPDFNNQDASQAKMLAQIQAGSYDPRATWGWSMFGAHNPANRNAETEKREDISQLNNMGPLGVTGGGSNAGAGAGAGTTAEGILGQQLKVTPASPLAKYLSSPARSGNRDGDKDGGTSRSILGAAGGEVGSEGEDDEEGEEDTPFFMEDVEGED